MPQGVFRVDAPEPPQIHVWQLEGFLFETITRHRYVGRLTPRYGVTCGVEKEYLAWPITKRSLVRVQPPQQVRRETVALIFAHIFSFPSKEGFGEGVHGVREKQIRFRRPQSRFDSYLLHHLSPPQNVF